MTTDSPTLRSLVSDVARPRWGYATGLVLLAAALLLAVVGAVSLGAVAIPARTTIGVVLDRLSTGSVEVSWPAVHDQIVWQYRLPRTLLAAAVGAGLAMVGAALQATVRNPLADPWVLGVSSGAGLGAVAALVLGVVSARGLGFSAAAFVGAACAMSLVFGMARFRGRLTPLRMVLTGVALSYLFSAATSYLVLTTDAEQVFGVLFFLLGNLGSATWSTLPVPYIVVTLAGVHLMARSRPMDALLAGEETAAALGVDTTRLRAELLLQTSLLTGIMVAVSGGIGFVGLVVPHISRLLVGASHRRMLPVAMLVGATFLVVVDLAARTIADPVELPVGIVTAILGVPFFLWLMRRSTAAQRGGLDR